MQEEPTPRGGPDTLLTRAERPTSRATRFTGGFVAGLLLIPLVFVGGFAAMLIVIVVGGQLDGQRHSSGWHVSSGRDISREGGAVAVWERRNEFARQTCRGSCDDLAFVHVPAEAVEVRRSDGRVLWRKAPWPASLLTGRGPGGGAWRPQLKPTAGTPS